MLQAQQAAEYGFEFRFLYKVLDAVLVLGHRVSVALSDDGAPLPLLCDAIGDRFERDPLLGGHLKLAALAGRGGANRGLGLGAAFYSEVGALAALFEALR